MSITSQLSLGLIPEAPQYGQMAAQNEKKRQAIINLGQSQIDAIFGGGSAPFYQTAVGKYDPSQQYFQLTPKGFQQWNYQGGGHSGTNRNKTTIAAADPAGPLGIYAGVSNLATKLFGRQPTRAEIAQTKLKNQRLFTQSSQDFAGFGPDFYSQRAKAYENFALPQLAEQERTTGNAINYGLANRGLLGGSAQTTAYGQFGRQEGQARQTIADTALQQSQQLQSQVEDARNQAINYLYQTADPAGVSAQAIRQAAVIQQPNAYAPLGQMFSNLLSQYYTNKLLGSTQPSSFIAPPDYGTNFSGALPK